MVDVVVAVGNVVDSVLDVLDPCSPEYPISPKRAPGIHVLAGHLVDGFPAQTFAIKLQQREIRVAIQ